MPPEFLYENEAEWKLISRDVLDFYQFEEIISLTFFPQFLNC